MKYIIHKLFKIKHYLNIIIFLLDIYRLIKNEY